jgi:hypothetical protein
MPSKNKKGHQKPCEFERNCVLVKLSMSSLYVCAQGKDGGRNLEQVTVLHGDMI